MRRLLVLAVAFVVGFLPALVVLAVVPATGAGASARPRGIDVANYQHPNGQPIDWSQVAASGIEFTFIKATEGPVSCTGSYYTNNWFKPDWDGAGANGLYRGAYHFAEPGDVNSAIIQARYFVSRVGPMNGPRDLPPVLDFETTCGLDHVQLAAFAHAWLDEVERLTGRQAIITTYPSFWSGPMAGDTTFRNYPMWIATYGSAPSVPPAWPYWTFWQDSSTGAVPGVPARVDTDWYQFGTDGLAALANRMNHDPFGSVDFAVGGSGSIRVGGWTLDLDTFSPIQAHVYVDGAFVAAVPANLSRPDVAGYYTGWGPNHGFDATVGTVAGGTHQVCVFGISAGQGENRLIGCRYVDVRSADPFGVVDRAAGGLGSVRVQGWAVDPDTSASIGVHVYVDGAFKVATTTDVGRADVSAAFSTGPSHGFDIPVPNLAPGPHVVCTFGINAAGYGVNRLLDCRTVVVPGGSPLGGLDLVQAGPGSAHVKGWALDPDTASPTPVHVYVDGAYRMTTSAGAPFPNFDLSFPGAGNNHGYDTTVPLTAGTHQVCTFAINIAGAGINPLLGCQSVSIGGSPWGNVDVVSGGAGSVRVLGWAIDPDTATATRAHVYIDGAFATEVTAGTNRPDIGAAFPLYGPGHGFDVSLSGLAPGVHQVCTFALDLVAPGSHRLMDCRNVAVG